MTVYLLDTCVVSELVKPKPAVQVVAWVGGLADEAVRISVITLGELQRGVLRLAEGKRKAELREWLAGLCQRYSTRLLDVTPDIAFEWGALNASAEASGRILPVMDSWIAATARAHSCTVATRNDKDFPTCPVYDPWDGS